MVLRNEIILFEPGILYILMIFVFGRAPVFYGVITQFVQTIDICLFFEVSKEGIEVLPGSIPI